MRYESTKWGGRPHWHFDAVLLGTDAYGRWLGAPAGTWLQRGVEPPVRWPCDFAVLVPATGDWVACFNASGKYQLYIDVTGPVTIDGNTVRADDLDLDVVRLPTGEVRLLDEEEFAAHQLILGYPAAVIVQARATADWLMRAVEADVEPFATVGAAWLRKVGVRPDAGASLASGPKPDRGIGR
jgi:predicted RNA-binding protein associated with RNAse of E/G family